MESNRNLYLPFEDEQQLITAHYGNGYKHQIIVPPQLQLNQGMFLPDHIIEQEEFRPNYGLKPKDLIAFNYAKAEYNKGIISDKCVHFYLYDYMFQCINNHPLRYTSMLMSYPMVISPDNSVYLNWTEHERRQSAWRNQQMTRLWQINGIPVIFNVSWAGPESYDYCIRVYPKQCVIAINCMGIKGDPDACYFWHLGYEEVIKSLEPSLIIRYGDKMEGEYEEISIYFDNQILKVYIMGGNGAYDHHRNYSLDIYSGDRFNEVGMIGNNKVVSTSVKKKTSIPVNCFNSKMYYVTSPDDPTKIVAIAFYSGRTHKIVKSIDLVYDKSGNLVPFKQVKRKGKIHKEGTHTHNWSGNKEKGEVGRKSHDKKNFFEPTKSDIKFIKKALKYNQEHQK